MENMLLLFSKNNFTEIEKELGKLIEFKVLCDVKFDETIYEKDFYTSKGEGGSHRPYSPPHHTPPPALMMMMMMMMIGK